MKIAFLNIYQGHVERGAETFVKELTQRLSEDHKVDVLSSNEIIPKRWPILWRVFLDPQGLAVALFTLKQLPKLLRERYDIVVPLNGGWQVAFVRLATWLYGGKMVISGQAGIGWDERNNIYSFPDCFVALSSKAKNWAKKNNPFVRVQYIPNGVDLSKFTKKGKKYVHGLKHHVILCVSALEEGKRIDLTIKAVSELDNASLLVLGVGEKEKELREMGNNLLGERFKLTNLPHDQMPEVYRSADVFTTPSRSHYAFEIVIVEALASGLPVVVNDDTIRKEIVGDAGLYVDPKDTEEYKRQLKRALKTEWGDKPVLRSKSFSWEMISRKYEKIFRSLLK